MFNIVILLITLSVELKNLQTKKHLFKKYSKQKNTYFHILTKCRKAAVMRNAQLSRFLIKIDHSCLTMKYIPTSFKFCFFWLTNYWKPRNIKYVSLKMCFDFQNHLAEKICPECGKVYKSKSGFSVHMQKHKKEFRYKCCGKEFYRACTFQRHR